MLAMYLGLSLILVLVNANGTARELPLELRAPVYFLGTALSVAFVILCLRLAERKARRGRGVVLHGTPVLFAASILGLYAGETLSMITTASEPLGFVEGLLLSFFYYVVAEIVVALSVAYLVPRAMAEIRGGAPAVTAPAPRPAQAAANLPDVPAGGTVTVLHRRGIETVRVGNTRFLVPDIQLIEAEGNYVRVVTQRGRDLLPGPFSQVIAQMPETAGQVISRSCWVASGMVIAHRRAGRDLFLLLTDGKELRVAAGRREQVMAWLRQRGVIQVNAAG
jgi:4-amino-4-deoxy-L-arabinose transferase-like glycosyltransferase